MTSATRKEQQRAWVAAKRAAAKRSIGEDLIQGMENALAHVRNMNAPGISYSRFNAIPVRGVAKPPNPAYNGDGLRAIRATHGVGRPVKKAG